MCPPPPPITIPGPGGPIPALMLGDGASTRAAVILQYGLSGTMEVQWPEAQRLAAAGHVVLIPEAPHHGLRADGFLDRMAGATAPEARSLFLELVAESARETRSLVDHLSRSGASQFVVAAISLGSPRRFIGVRLMMRALAASLVSTAFFASSVAMVPGATALTRTPWSASDSAITRVSWSMAPLLAL